MKHIVFLSGAMTLDPHIVHLDVSGINFLL